MITIQNNKRQRRILIFDSMFNLEESNDFPRELFDAVFVLASSADEVKSILNIINPVTSRKCCYKPFLVSRDLKGQLDEYDELIDCYTYDIDDSETLDTVDGIIHHVEHIGLQPDEHRFLSGNLFFIRLYRYLISRGVYRLTPVLNGLSGMGYTIPLFELFFRLGAYSLNEYILFNQSLLEKRYTRIVGFINKIYLCPQCLHSHLLYIENCPRCHSSAIRSEEVIHHFRCANISPEHTYNFGGQLRCPKCHRLLHHIGVDYDRPSVVYSCSNCENTFLQPRMTAVCTTCQNRSDVSALTPYDVSAFEITQEGCEAIVSPNIGFTIYTDFYDNYMEFERFVGRLRMLSNLKGTGETDADIEVIKVWILNAEEETCPPTSDFIARLCKRFPTYRFSSANHMVYLKNAGYEEGGQSDAKLAGQLDLILDGMTLLLSPGERICYAVARCNGNIEEFVHNLHYVEPFPDRTFVSDRTEEPAPVADPSEESIIGLQEEEPEERVESSSFSTEEVEAKKTSSRFLFYVLMFFGIVAVLFAGFLFYRLWQASGEASLPPMEIETEQQPLLSQPVSADAVAAGSAGTIAGISLDTLVVGSSAEPAEQKEFYLVVTHSFQSKTKAKNRLLMEQARHPEYEYRLYRHSNGAYVISPFRSFDREECKQFTARQTQWTDAWVATGKDNKEVAS